MFKANQKKNKKKKREADVIDVVLVYLSLTLNIFHTFSSVFIVDFERVNVSSVLPVLVFCS